MSVIPKLNQTSQEAIAATVAENRSAIDQQRADEEQDLHARIAEGQNRLLMYGAVGAAALVLLGVKAVNYNHVHSPVNLPPTPPTQVSP